MDTQREETTGYAKRGNEKTRKERTQKDTQREDTSGYTKRGHVSIYNSKQIPNRTDIEVLAGNKSFDAYKDVVGRFGLLGWI